MSVTLEGILLNTTWNMSSHNGGYNNTTEANTERNPNQSVADLQFLQYLWLVITPALFGLIIIFGSCGNFLVIYVIIRNNMTKNLNNILLMNLAIADILFLWSCLPFQAYKFAAFDFPMGNMACKLIQYSLYLTAYVTVWTLVAIAGLRYLTVVKSSCTAHIRTRKNVMLICVVLWAIMVVINTPALMSHKLNTWKQIEYCGLIPKATKSMLVTFFTFAYVIPLFTIVLLYIMISQYLCYQTSQTCHLSSRLRRRIRQEKAIKTVTVVVIVFAVSWLPLHIHNLYSAHKELPSSMMYEVCRVLWYCMAYGNSLANPIIYNFTSEEFKKAFKGSLSCCKGYSSGMLLWLRRSSRQSNRAFATSSMVTVQKSGEDISK